MKILLTLFISFYTASSFAGWTLDPDGSRVGFASVKNDLVAENHHFKMISGHVSGAGEVEVTIPLTSVETSIPIRNERMQKMLFETDLYPDAVITASIDTKSVASSVPGQTHEIEVPMTINLHGMVLEKTVLVKVTTCAEGVYDVTSLGPIMVHASQFSLSDGVEALRKIAGLQSINLMVPVTFTLRFVADKEASKESR